MLTYGYQLPDCYWVRSYLITTVIWDVFESIVNCEKMWKVMERDRLYDLRPLVQLKIGLQFFLCVLMRQRTDKMPIVKSLVKSEVHSYKLLKWFAGIFRSRFKTVLIQDVLKCTAMCTVFRHFKRPQCLEISQWVNKIPKEHIHIILKKTGNHMNYMH